MELSLPPLHDITTAVLFHYSPGRTSDLTAPFACTQAARWAITVSALPYGQFLHPLSQHEPRATRYSREIAPPASRNATNLLPHPSQTSPESASRTVRHFSQNRSIPGGIIEHVNLSPRPDN